MISYLKAVHNLTFYGGELLGTTYKSLIFVGLIVEEGEGQDDDDEEGRGHVDDVPEDFHVHVGACPEVPDVQGKEKDLALCTDEGHYLSNNVMGLMITMMALQKVEDPKAESAGCAYLATK